MSDGIINAVKVEGNTTYTGSIVRIQALSSTSSIGVGQAGTHTGFNTASLHSIRFEDRDALLGYPHSQSLGADVGTTGVGAVKLTSGHSIEGPIRQFAVEANSNPVLVYLRRG